MNVVGDFDVLAETILQKARTEAEEMVDRARRVAQRDVEHAREEAETLRRERLQRAQQRIEQEQRRSYGQIDIDAQRRRMAQQEELIQAVFRSALDALRSMSRDEKYAQILVRLIEEGVVVIGGDRGTMVLNRVDGKVFGGEKMRWLEQQVSERLGRDVQFALSDQAIEASGGVFLCSEDARVSFDNTFEGRLERNQDELRGAVAEVLFGPR